MKKILFVGCLLLSASFAFAQKDEFEFDKKTGLVTDNAGALLFKVEYVKSVTTALMDDYYFRGPDDKLLIVFKYITYKDPRLVSQSNPHGNESYYEIKFFSDPVMESECNYVFLKGLVKRVYEKKLIDKGALNMERVKEFVTINGNTYSRRRSELYGRY